MVVCSAGRIRLWSGCGPRSGGGGCCRSWLGRVDPAGSGAGDAGRGGGEGVVGEVGGGGVQKAGPSARNLPKRECHRDRSLVLARSWHREGNQIAPRFQV